jgi:hypothetical protein
LRNQYKELASFGELHALFIRKFASRDKLSPPPLAVFPVEPTVVLSRPLVCGLFTILEITTGSVDADIPAIEDAAKASIISLVVGSLFAPDISIYNSYLNIS